METDHRTRGILALVGLSAGAAAGVWLWSRRPRPGRAHAGPVPATHATLADALRDDPTLAEFGVGVDIITDGVIELTGSVGTREQAERAVEVAQGGAGIHTVLNRLEIEAEESHREDSRRRHDDGAPELRSARHYGMGVGMGPRRQSPGTDPDRPSDRQHRIERQLDVARMAEDLPAGDAQDAGEPSPRHPGPGPGVAEEGLAGEHRM